MTAPQTALTDEERVRAKSPRLTALLDDVIGALNAATELARRLDLEVAVVFLAAMQDQGREITAEADAEVRAHYGLEVRS